MPSTVTCPACGRQLGVPDQFTGGRAKCMGCNNRLAIHRAGDGSFTAEVLAGGLVPIVKPAPKPTAPAADVFDAEWSESRRDEPPPLRSRRASDDLGVRVPRQPPFLTQRGAVINCPHCGRIARIEARDFNFDLQCQPCRGFFRVVVPREGGIPFNCPHCRIEMVVGYRQAGREVDCIDCGQLVLVPRRALLIKRLSAPEPDPSPSQVVRSGPRRCSICQRQIRNPLPLCYKCQRMLGL
jgi:ribosomal protein S27E